MGMPPMWCFNTLTAYRPYSHSGMEKPNLLHTGTCTSTRTRHVTLKSLLLLQFPYFKLCDNYNKQ